MLLKSFWIFINYAIAKPKKLKFWVEQSVTQPTPNLAKKVLWQDGKKKLTADKFVPQ
jgi:hypothetical protein